MKAKKTRTIKKILQITVLCLFAAAFLLPKGSQSYLMTGIAAAGVIVSLALLIIPPLASGLRKLQIPAGRAMDTGNGNSDLGNHPDPADQLSDHRHTSVCFSGSHLGICRTPASFPPAGRRCDPLIYQEHR